LEWRGLLWEGGVLPEVWAQPFNFIQKLKEPEKIAPLVPELWQILLLSSISE
jgi:hypothetical protein